MARIANLLILMSCAHGALAGEWRSQEGSELLFEPTWEGEALRGRFDRFDVRLETDAAGIAGAKLTVTVQLESADMDDPDINEAIAGAEWFAVNKHPVATFTSNSIEQAADGDYIACGQLELKGVRLPVDVPFQWAATGDRAEMSGELVIDRTRFNVGSGEWADGEQIGTAVGVSFDVVLERH